MNAPLEDFQPNEDAMYPKQQEDKQRAIDSKLDAANSEPAKCRLCLVIVMDQDCKDCKIWRKEPGYPLVHFDSGHVKSHVKKNVAKSAKIICKTTKYSTKDFVTLGDRLGKRFMSLVVQVKRLAKEKNLSKSAAQTMFLELWLHTMRHFSVLATTLAPACMLDQTSGKFFLDTREVKGAKIAAGLCLLVEAVARRVRYHVQRGASPPSHEVEFWKSFFGRCMLTICWSHCNHATVLLLLEKLHMPISDLLRDGCATKVL